MGVISIAKFISQNAGNRGRLLRQFARGLEWQLYKNLIRKPRTLTLPNGVKFRAYPDCVISSALHYARWPEYAELQFCRRNLRPGDLVIDVGANVGHFSLLLGDLVGPRNLHCFEPTPISWRRLVENFVLNEWPTEKLFQCAVGRKPGTLQFLDLDKPETTNCCQSSAYGKTVSVEMTALDEYAAKLDEGSVGLLKVDVEGYEREVFAGADRLFRCIRPRPS